MTISYTLCATCVHLHRDNHSDTTCDAFPEGIPAEIIESRFDHHEPHPDDNGIQFAPITNKED